MQAGLRERLRESMGTRRGRRRWLASIGLALLALVGLIPASRGCQPRTAVLADVPRPIVFAHRGGSGEAAENTLAAMQAAIAGDPAVAIETDVRRSRDGHLVLIHDATVDRTTNGRGAVDALTLAELQALDAGYCATPGVGRGTASASVCRGTGDAGRFPLRGRGHRIPTLAEVLAALPGQTLIGIEVKAAGFEEQLARQLRESGRLRRLVVGSAIDGVSDRLRRLLPEVPHYFPRWAGVRLAAAAKLSNGHLSRPVYQVLALPREGGGFQLDTPGMVQVAHRLGLAITYWTINDAPEMERLLRLGADGIITDYPRRARAVVEALRPR
jgi:glycerophosphoryl diester phosphodiesterase